MSTPTISVVIPCGPMGYAALPRCLSSLNRSICDEILICRFEASHLAVQHDLPVRDVPVAYVPDIASALVRAGIEHATSDWVLLLYPNEWLTGPLTSMQERIGQGIGIANPPTAFPIRVLEDSAGVVQRDQLLEVRLVSKKAPFAFNGKSFIADSPAVAPVFICSQPFPAFYFEAGDIEAAYRLAQPSGGSDGSRIEKRINVLARTELDKRKARAALWTLFNHMSSHEELWRLGEILDHLPYTLEDDPSIAEMRKLYAKQMGHLERGAERWYAKGSYSPMHGIDAVYVGLGIKALAHRCKWLIEDCRKRGFKRVLELGSTDGNNLFPMTQAAPDLEFHGVEVSAEAVAHAKDLSASTGIKINITNARFERFAERCCRYDAVAVFEVLEHNSPSEGTAILDAAEKCVRPGGRVYITTPCGSWSCHDEACWDLKTRKDHVNAFTVSRMRSFLEARGAKDLQVERVENPQFEEGNSWIFASFMR